MKIENEEKRTDTQDELEERERERRDVLTNGLVGKSITEKSMSSGPIFAINSMIKEVKEGNSLYVHAHDGADFVCVAAMQSNGKRCS